MTESLGGFVTSPRPIIGKQCKIDQEGLFSEVIFGPQHNYNCACGNYNSRVLYAGKVCPKCGVLCDTNDLRYETFGKIKTVFPVVKPSKRDFIVKVIGEKNRIMINPIRAEVIKAIPRYLAVKTDKSDVKIVNSQEPINNYMIIPFRITGLYGLYLCMKFINIYFQVPSVKEIFDNQYFTNIIKVLPPNLRMITFDATKNEIRTPEINRVYTSLLNLNKANALIEGNLYIDEEDWIEKIRIMLKDQVFDQDIEDPTILEYDIKAAQYQFWVDEIYKMVYAEISGKEGLIRNSILGKNIEFSARTVITVDPSIKPYQVKVSKNILKRLWMPYFLYYLTTYKEIQFSYCFETFMLNESENQDQFNRLFDEFLEWFTKND